MSICFKLLTKKVYMFRSNFTTASNDGRACLDPLASKVSKTLGDKSLRADNLSTVEPGERGEIEVKPLPRPPKGMLSSVIIDIAFVIASGEEQLSIIPLGLSLDSTSIATLRSSPDLSLFDKSSAIVRIQRQAYLLPLPQREQPVPYRNLTLFQTGKGQHRLFAKPQAYDIHP